MEKKHIIIAGMTVVFIFLLIIVLAILDIIPLVATIIFLGIIIGLSTGIILLVYVFKRATQQPEAPKQTKFSKDDAVQHAIQYIKEIIGDNPQQRGNRPIQWIGSPNTEKSPILRLDFYGRDRLVWYVFIYNLMNFKEYWGYLEFQQLNEKNEREIREYMQGSAIDPQISIKREMSYEVDPWSGTPMTNIKEERPYISEPKKEEVKVEKKEEAK